MSLLINVNSECPIKGLLQPISGAKRTFVKTPASGQGPSKGFSVVHAGPLGGTYCRFSSQIAPVSGGLAGAYRVAQGMQMNARP